MSSLLHNATASPAQAQANKNRAMVRRILNQELRSGISGINAGNITGDLIAAGTITAGSIAAGTITSTQIAAGTILAGNIAAATITSAQIAAFTIVGGNIAANTITGTNIAATTITASNIAAGTITGTQIAAFTITAGKLAANTITAAQIQAGSITGTEIAAGTIMATNIGVDTITAGNIAANAITSSELAANSVTAAKIVANTITAGQIAADTLTASEIAANAITTSELAANAVTAAKIAANTITAGQIAAGTITTAQIASGTITGSNIAGSTITASNITISQLSALAADLGTITAGTVTGATVRTAASGARMVMSTSGLTGYNSGGTAVFDFSTSTGNLSITGAIQSGSTLPANIVGSSNIVDGTVTGTDIASATIVAANIVSGTITTTQIAANTIVAGNIASGTITGTQIAASTIATGNLAAGAVTAAKISVTSLSAIAADLGTITAGTITGGTIQTASSGARALLDTTGISLLDSSSGLLVSLPITGTPFFKGKLSASGGVELTSTTSSPVTAAQKTRWIHPTTTAELGALYAVPSGYGSRTADASLLASVQTAVNYAQLVAGTTGVIHHWRMQSAYGSSDEIAAAATTVLVQKAGDLPNNGFPTQHYDVATAVSSSLVGGATALQWNLTGDGTYEIGQGDMVPAIYDYSGALPSSIVPANISMEMWITLPATGSSAISAYGPGTGTLGQIVALESSGGTATAGFFYDPSANKMRFRIVTAGGTTDCIDTGTLTAGTLYHFVGTYDGANMKLYRNKVLQTTTAKTGSVSSSAKMRFQNTTQAVKCTLDEVAIYTSALTAANIQDHYDLGATGVTTTTTSIEKLIIDSASKTDFLLGAPGGDGSIQICYAGIDGSGNIGAGSGLSTTMTVPVKGTYLMFAFTGFYATSVGLKYSNVTVDGSFVLSNPFYYNNTSVHMSHTPGAWTQTFSTAGSKTVLFWAGAGGTASDSNDSFRLYGIRIGA